MLNSRAKLLSWEELPRWRRRLREGGQPLVVTNGCFDLLHAGHVMYLEAARNLGAALLVGLNSDASVRALKGPDRPINREEDRGLVLAALEAVSGVVVFQDLRAIGFLRVAQPDIYVKGGDYTLDTLDVEEKRAVEQAGGRIVLIPMVPGKSTSSVIRKLRISIAPA